MRHISPLRYPGGKAVLSTFLADTIDLNDLRGCNYYEPYAGGAGAALSMLADEVVSRVFLNDADIRIYAFWRAALHHSERFVREINRIPLTIDEWKRQNQICAHPWKHKMFDIGFAAFYMNRCNRSGVLTGAGPIGGYEQAGKWRINVRFNRETLSERILKLSKYKRLINVSRDDAIVFLKENLPKGRGRGRVFVYLDPPYVNKGKRLYLNAYGADEHGELARYLHGQKTLTWIMSYDDSNLVRYLYSSCRISLLPIRYTLQSKKTAHELIITPDGVNVPFACRMGRTESPLQQVV